MELETVDVFCCSLILMNFIRNKKGRLIDDTFNWTRNASFDSDAVFEFIYPSLGLVSINRKTLNVL